MKDWILANKTVVGTVLQGTFSSLLLNKDILLWFAEHPMYAAWILSLANGLAMAGILKSDKEQRTIQLIKKLDEAPTAEIK